ncbi:MAG: hypothetical protein ACQESG_03710 [Nanobdellota archaeon]
MEISRVVERIKESDAFKNWNSDGYYLAHFFKMMDEANADSWQVGYFNPETENMVTFIIEGNDVSLVEDAEVFKKPDTTINEMDLDAIKVGWQASLDKAHEHLKENYGQETLIKTFFILQNLPMGVVYNITFLTKSFNTINLKISATSGEILQQSKESLMDMARFEKGEKGEH